MLVSLEEFSKAYEHSIAALAAVGTVLAGFATVAAVWVSLHLARRNERVRLKAVLSIGISAIPPSTQRACIIITNVGMRAAWLPLLFFEWKIPFRRKKQPETLANSINKVYVTNPRRELPVSKDTVITLWEMANFRDEMNKEYVRIGAHVKWFKRYRLRRLSGRIYTQDGSEFPVTFSRAIREALREALTTVFPK
jgi:hypothetical protein